MKSTITIDIETRRLAQEVGGWGALKKGAGGISCVVGWSSITGRPHIFGPEDLEECGDFIERHECIIGYNSVDFDIPILQGILKRDLSFPLHLDLLQIIWDSFPPWQTRFQRGYKLDLVCKRTIGEGKTGDGALAPELADKGLWAELHNYCLADVAITRKLAMFVQKNGYILDKSNDQMKLNLPDWIKELAF